MGKISEKEPLNKGHLSIKDTRFCPCYNILARRRKEGVKGGRKVGKPTQRWVEDEFLGGANGFRHRLRYQLFHCLGTHTNTHTRILLQRSGDFSERLTRGISQRVVMQHRPHPDILIQNLFYTSLEAGQVGVNSDHSKELE